MDDTSRTALTSMMSDRLYDNYYTIKDAKYSREIFAESWFPYLILVLSHFFAYTCFPSIIVYKQLPGDLFNPDKVADVYDFNEKIAWQGVINDGLFLICFGVGILTSNNRWRPTD